MKNSNSDGFLTALMFVATVISWIGSGAMAWNWVEPESFGGAIFFLIAWGLLGKIFDIIAVAVIAGLASIIE